MHVYPNYYKNFSAFKYKNKFSSGEYKNNKSIIWLRLIAQVRNISGYENKSKDELIKALSEPKFESPKPEMPKPEIPKLKTPKLLSSKLKISKSKITKQKPRPRLRPEIRANKKKFKKLTKILIN